MPGCLDQWMIASEVTLFACGLSTGLCLGRERRVLETASGNASITRR